MHVLAVETATTSCSIALASNTTILAEMLLHEQHHSENILPCIERILTDTARARDQIDCIAVDIGPGSFTGLRVGISTAQGLALALGRPLVGVSSLEILARQVATGAAGICPMIDAPRGQVYTCFYTVDESGRLVTRHAATVACPDAWVRSLSGRVVFTGPGALRYQNVIRTAYPEHALFVMPALAHPRASTLAMIAHEAHYEGRSCAPEFLTPQYIRQPDALLPHPHQEDSGK